MFFFKLPLFRKHILHILLLIPWYFPCDTIHSGDNVCHPSLSYVHVLYGNT